MTAPFIFFLENRCPPQNISPVGAIYLSVLTGVDTHVALTGLRLVWCVLPTVFWATP